MKEVKKEDIELMKIVALNMKKTILNDGSVKDIDLINNSVVNIFNFEQRMIDLINEKLLQNNDIEEPKKLTKAK